jgi:hypothetical protein
MADNNPFSGLDSLLVSSSPQGDNKNRKDPTTLKTRKKSRKLGEKKTKSPILDSKSSRSDESTKLVNQPDQPVKSTNSVNQSSQPVDSTKTVNRSSQPINSVNRPNQSTRLVEKTSPVNSSIAQSTNSSSSQIMGEMVKRPLAFYIPVATNDKLEEAVKFYQKKYHRKIDRSTVVSAILGELSLWDPQNLDQLAPKVMAQLENRLREHLANRLAESTS